MFKKFVILTLTLTASGCIIPQLNPSHLQGIHEMSTYLLEDGRDVDTGHEMLYVEFTIRVETVPGDFSWDFGSITKVELYNDAGEIVRELDRDEYDPAELFSMLESDCEDEPNITTEWIGEQLAEREQAAHDEHWDNVMRERRLGER